MKTVDLNVPDILPLWVGLTSRAEFPPALSRDEALRRARELLGILRKGMLPNQRIEADEDVKHVLYALCELLREPGREGQLLLDDANAVYHFIESVQWPDDVLEEKSELLLECAEIGWEAIGLSIAEVTRQRQARSSAEAFLTDPIPCRDHEEGLTQTQALRELTLQCKAPQSKTDLTRPPVSERPNDLFESCIAQPGAILALVGELRERCNSVPAIVHEEAASLYRLLNERADRVGVFDEGHYFAGETALMAGATCRLLGKREDAELWFDRAESRYQRTINPSAALGRVSLERLNLLYESRHYERVFEILPLLAESFGKWGMVREILKCRLLEALTLKETARLSEAVDRLRSLKNDASVASETAIRGVILAHLAELVSSNGDHLEATSIYKEALSLQHDDHQPIALAHLKVAMGEGLREQGRFEEAVESYRSAISDYAGLGIQTYAALLRVLTSEMLIALSRYREAEWEILAALPTIEEQKMVPEGFAAVALLKESVRRRKTDPNALRELREHLQASK